MLWATKFDDLAFHINNTTTSIISLKLYKIDAHSEPITNVLKTNKPESKKNKC